MPIYEHHFEVCHADRSCLHCRLLMRTANGDSQLACSKIVFSFLRLAWAFHWNAIAPKNDGTKNDKVNPMHQMMGGQVMLKNKVYIEIASFSCYR